MRLPVILLAVVSTWFYGIEAQVHYVPAQLLVPVYNASGINIANHTWYNNSRPSYGWNIPPSYVGSQNAHNNTSYGWNAPNYGNPNTYRPNYRNGSVFNTTNTTTPEGNLMVGTIGLYDRLLFTKEYYKPGRWWSSREKTIEYPKDIASGYLRHETIRAIRIYNLLYNGKKARAEILAGGIGRQYVKIRLSSNWKEGFKFLVQIYGS